MNLPISKLPAKVLRTKVENISFPLDKPLRRLLLDMVETVQVAEGIGLAAPQVGKSLNLALIFLADDGIEPFFIFNPRIVEVSAETTEIEEGCLSLPGVYGLVSRPKKVTVEYTDVAGNLRTLTDDAWIARVLQHEIDHLNGTLIADKLNTITKGAHLLPKYLGN